MSLEHLRTRWRFRLDGMSPGPERRILRDLLSEWDENTLSALADLSEEVTAHDHAEALAEALALFVQGVDEFWLVPGRAKDAMEKARAALAAYRAASPRGGDEP
jgi:hypothetical protein